MTLSAAATIGQLLIRCGAREGGRDSVPALVATGCAGAAGGVALPAPAPRASPHMLSPCFCPCRHSHTIKTFGALLFATVMTTRQFISILLSCILFAHPLTGGQWLGTIMVFGEAALRLPGPAAWLPGPAACLPGLLRRLRCGGDAAEGRLAAGFPYLSVSRHVSGCWRCRCRDVGLETPPAHPHAPPRLRHAAGALYYKSLARGGSKGGSHGKEGAAGEGAPDAEKLPLVHADATAAAQGGDAVPAEPLK